MRGDCASNDNGTIEAPTLASAANATTNETRRSGIIVSVNTAMKVNKSPSCGQARVRVQDI